MQIRPDLTELALEAHRFKARPRFTILTETILHQLPASVSTALLYSDVAAQSSLLTASISVIHHSTCLLRSLPPPPVYPPFTLVSLLFPVPRLPAFGCRLMALLDTSTRLHLLCLLGVVDHSAYDVCSMSSWYRTL
ncbi:hypothetical protein MIR68_004490 [Amoeboaphelidium protococcarum]|nr:hypothetical protein MIR68_004490 [Amoeboaphelidium protococcarum]